MPPFSQNPLFHYSTIPPFQLRSEAELTCVAEFVQLVENKEVFSGFDVFAPHMEYWNDGILECRKFPPNIGGS